MSRRTSSDKPQNETGKVTIVVAVIAFLGVLITALFGYLGNREEASPITPTPVIPIAIDSTKDWQPTGIIVGEGEEIRVRVIGGVWAVYRLELSLEHKSGLAEDLQRFPAWLYTWGETAGEGASGTCNDLAKADCPVNEFNLGGLIGKVGNAEPFGIGKEKTFQAPDDGELWLRINENNARLLDNHGILAVEVSLGH
jgi:hypothetical protein